MVKLVAISVWKLLIRVPGVAARHPDTQVLHVDSIENRQPMPDGAAGIVGDGDAAFAAGREPPTPQHSAATANHDENRDDGADDLRSVDRIATHNHDVKQA